MRISFRILALAGTLCALSIAAHADYYEDALNYQQKGETKAAIIQLKNLLQSSPKHAKGRLLLGEIYFAEGQLAEAEKEIKRAIELGSKGLEPVIKLIKIQVQQGKTASAQATLDELWPSNQQIEQRHLFQGQIFLQQRKLAEAENSFYQVLQLNDNPNASLGLAMIARLQGDSKRALDLLTPLKDDADISSQARLMEVELLLESRQADQAHEEIKVLKRDNPDNQAFDLLLANALLLKADFDGAQKALNGLPEKFHRAPQYLLFSAMAAMGKKQYLEAFSAAEQLLQMTPDNPRALLIAGGAQYLLKDYAKAETYLQPFVSMIPADPNGRRLLAASQQNLQQPQAALKTLEPLLNLADTDAQSLAIAGYAQISLGNWEEGEDLLNRALKKNPDLEQLRDSLAFSQILGGKSDSALKSLEEDNSLKSLSLRIMALLQQGKAQEAHQLVQQGMDKQPKEVGLPILNALIYLREQNIAEARSSYQQALDIDSNHPGAQLGLIRLDLAEGNLDATEKGIKQLLRQDPKFLPALMARVALEEKKGNEEAMLKALKEAKRQQPDALQPISSLVAYYAKQKQWDKARHEAHSFYLTNKENLGAKYLYAKVLQQTGKVKDAYAMASQLVEKQPNHPQYLKLYIELLLADGKAAQAETYSTRLLERSPNDPQVIYTHTGLLLKLGKLEAAESYGKRLLQLSPNPSVERLYGMVKLAQQQPEAALQHLNAAGSATEDAGLSMAKANAYLLQKNTAAAISELETSFNAHQFPAVGLQLAGLYQQQQQLDQAISVYETLRQKTPENPIPWNNLAWIYQQKNDIRSLDYAREALRLAPDRGDIKDTLGWILYGYGEYQEALGLLKDAAKQLPNYEEVQWHYGAALMKAEQTAEAERVLKPLADKPGPFQRQARDTLQGK